MVDKIKIGNIDYDVVVDTAELEDHGRLGEINYKRATIKVSDQQNEQVKYNTLVHEAVHGMLRFLGEDERNRDEESVERIANGLLMLIKDNPKLFGLK